MRSQRVCRDQLDGDERGKKFGECTAAAQVKPETIGIYLALSLNNKNKEIIGW